jgi:hypothetical protein
MVPPSQKGPVLEAAVDADEMTLTEVVAVAVHPFVETVTV